MGGKLKIEIHTHMKVERGILVLLLHDDDLLDQMTPIASAGPATVDTCIRVIEGVNESIANLLASNGANVAQVRPSH